MCMKVERDFGSFKKGKTRVIKNCYTLHISFLFEADYIVRGDIRLTFQSRVVTMFTV